MNTSWFTAETAAEETDERISKAIDGTIEQLKVNKEKRLMHLQIVDSEFPRDLVESDRLRPRSKKGQGGVEAVPVNLRIDKHIYEQITKQALSANLTINALLQYAIENLKENKQKIKIVSDDD